MDDGEMTAAGRPQVQGLCQEHRNICRGRPQKKVTPYEWGKEVAPRIRVDRGHTPGHTS